MTKEIQEQKKKIKSQPAIGQIDEGRLDEIVYIETKRSNGTVRIQQDFQYCTSLTEQHNAHVTDINYLMEKYKPDELAAYIAAKNAHRREILGHDFTIEPSLQDAKNIVYNLKKAFEQLPDEVRVQFRSHVDFLKFIDNPDNAQKMIKLGLLTPKQIAEATTTTTTPTTQEEKEKKKE